MSLHWEPYLAIGVPAVDAQHQELFRRVNGLLEAMHRQRGAAEVERLLEYLASYAVEHFRDEERLMAEAAYPAVAAHRREHAQFVQEMDALVLAFEAEGTSPAVVVKLNVWLCGWLRRHVSDSDQALGRYLADLREAGGRS